MDLLPKTPDAAKRFIKKIKHTPGKDYYAKSPNVPGLYLRVTGSGKKTWQVRYFIKVGDEHRSRKTTIGVYSDTPGDGLFTVTTAEQEAEGIRSSARRQGIDPIADAQAEAVKKANQEKAAELERMKSTTMLELFNLWREYSLYGHKDGGKEAARWIENKVLPRYGDMEVLYFSKKEFWEIIDPLKKEGKIRSSLIVLSQLKSMFAFAREREIIPEDHTPLDSINGKKRIGKWNERDRVLCEHPQPGNPKKILPDELAELFQKLPGSGLPRPSQLAINIALATCCRIGELYKARWEDIDLARGEWDIPAKNSKNGMPITIDLSPFAVEQLAELYSLTGSFEWLYPNRNGSNHKDPKTIARQIHDRQREEGNGKNKTQNCTTLALPRGRWTMHDLRRTGATLMGSLGVPGDVIEKCLNHKEANEVKRIYNRSVPIEEMKAAWGKLGAELQRLSNQQELKTAQAWREKVIKMPSRG